MVHIGLLGIDNVSSLSRCKKCLYLILSKIVPGFICVLFQTALESIVMKTILNFLFWWLLAQSFNNPQLSDLFWVKFTSRKSEVRAVKIILSVMFCRRPYQNIWTWDSWSSRLEHWEVDGALDECLATEEETFNQLLTSFSQHFGPKLVESFAKNGDMTK